MASAAVHAVVSADEETAAGVGREALLRVYGDHGPGEDGGGDCVASREAAGDGATGGGAPEAVVKNLKKFVEKE